MVEALALHLKYIFLMMNLQLASLWAPYQPDQRWLDGDQQCNFLQVYALRNLFRNLNNFLAVEIVLAKRASDRWFALARHFWHSPGRAGEC